MSTTTPPTTQLGEISLPPPPRPSEHIVMTPGVCGGKPRIAGHRIKVSNIVIDHEHHGMTPRQIVEAFPTINLAQVYAALSYYWDHREEIDAEIKADDEFFAAMKKTATSIIKSKKAGHDANDSLFTSMNRCPKRSLSVCGRMESM